MEDLTKILGELAVTLGAAIITAVIATLRPYVAQLLQAWLQHVQAKIGATNYALLLEIVRQVVRSIEQTSNGRTSEEKLSRALDAVQKELSARGLGYDGQEIITGLIEASVFELQK